MDQVPVMCQAPHWAMGHTGRSDSPLSQGPYSPLEETETRNREARESIRFLHTSELAGVADARPLAFTAYGKMGCRAWLRALVSIHPPLHCVCEHCHCRMPDNFRPQAHPEGKPISEQMSPSLCFSVLSEGSLLPDPTALPCDFVGLLEKPSIHPRVHRGISGSKG